MWTSGRAAAPVLLAAVFSLSASGARAEAPPPGHKSSGEAFAYSFFGTALPMVAGAVVAGLPGETDAAPVGFPILAGYLIGPSLGHFYAGRSKHAWIGIGVRTAAAGAFWAAAASYEEKSSDTWPVNTMMILCVSVGVFSTFVDIAAAPESARIHNRELGIGSLELTPALVGDAGTPGLRVDLRF